LALFARAGIIHGDLKPENIVLADGVSTSIKIIDFGGARFTNQSRVLYAQSRYYRAPEVLLHHPWSFPADMWAIGCVVGELFVGLPLFPGQSEIQMLEWHEKMIGPYRMEFVRSSPRGAEFFLEDGGLKPEEQYCHEQRIAQPPKFPYIAAGNLTQLIMLNPVKGESKRAIRRGKEKLADLLSKIFVYDTDQRLTPEQALAHPFFAPTES
jgi:serine/threonine protein kinase